MVLELKSVDLIQAHVKSDFSLEIQSSPEEEELAFIRKRDPSLFMTGSKDVFVDGKADIGLYMVI